MLKDRPWERVWQPPPEEESPDILAEERARPRRMWWPGNWLRGRGGIVILVLFFAGGLAYLVWERAELPDGGPAVPVPGAEDTPRRAVISLPWSTRRAAGTAGPCSWGTAGCPWSGWTRRMRSGS